MITRSRDISKCVLGDTNTAGPQWARGAFPKPPDELKSDWHDVDIRHV